VLESLRALRELPEGALTDCTDSTDSSVLESLRASVDVIEIWFKPRRLLAASQRGVFPKTKRVRMEVESFMVGVGCFKFLKL
jgi:hypothetical protein